MEDASSREYGDEKDGLVALQAHFETLLKHESDRGAALVGATLLEEAVRALVVLTFDEEHAKKLRALGRFGAIGTLNGAIEYAFAMGLISSHEKDEAGRVKDLRNVAAHSLVEGGLWSFDSALPVQWTTPLPPTYSERARFAIVVAGLVAAIWRRVNAARAIKVSAEGSRAQAISWLFEAVERPLLNRTYLAMFDADPPSQDRFDEDG